MVFPIRHFANDIVFMAYL